MTTETIFATYNTKTEADTFARTFNQIDMKGRTARVVQVGISEYQARIAECPEFVEFFFGAKRAAA
jgi:hypothetical protein